MRFLRWLYYQTIFRFCVYPFIKRRLYKEAEKFCEKHADDLIRWKKAHGDLKNMPCVLVNGEWQWLSRQERRKLGLK